MFNKLTVLLLLISFQAFSYVVPCGQGNEELNYPQHSWSEFFSIKFQSGFGEIDAIICVGKQADKDVFDIASFRDTDGGDQLSGIVTMDELLEGMNLLHTKELPDAAKLVVKDAELINGKLKILKETDSEVNFSFTFKFHRKLGKFSMNDIREMTIFGDYDKNYNTMTVFHKHGKSMNPKKENVINSVHMKLVLTDITEMGLYHFEKLSKKVMTNKLKRVRK